MTSFSTLARLPVGFLVGLSSGCVHRSSTSAPSPPSPPPPPSSVVTAPEIQRAPDRSIEQMLMGRFPGVAVARTVGGGISVRIRGFSSFLSSNEPLYVLDGTPLPPGQNGNFSWLNPYDVESIQVLKDPAEMGIYGIRGANGVIVIKMKRPGTRASVTSTTH